MATAMGVVALRALTLFDRGVANLFAEIPFVAVGAFIHQLGANGHPVRFVVARAALPGREWVVDGTKPRVGSRSGRRRYGRRIRLGAGFGWLLRRNFEEKVAQSLACVRGTPEDEHA